MTTVTMMFAPHDVMREAFFSKDIVKLANDNLARYVSAKPFESSLVFGEDAAEAAFDLTNNPSRQEEREEKYGRGRSLSVGDVVQVNESKWVCASMGWVKIA